MGILSLPDELLIEIFRAVKTHNPANKAHHTSFASSSGDIASVRLVCRRFEACSSHLLVHFIRIDGINSESLEKLEAISRHPVIRNGVHIVRLVTQFYTSTYANDVRRFAWHAVNRVFGLASRYKEDVEAAEDADAEGFSERRQEAAVVLANVKAILKTWGRVSLQGMEDSIGSWSVDFDKSNQDCMAIRRRNSGEQEKSEVERHLQLLHIAHQLYRLRFEDQERLRQNDAFIERFAAAVSRMPKAKGIEFHDFQRPQYQSSHEDGGTEQSGSFFPETDEYAGLVDMESLVQPMSWDEATDRQLGEPPIELVFRLPVAIHHAGARLDRISMQTNTCAEQYYPLFERVSMNDFIKLGTAINRMNLKSFIFLHQEEMKPRIRQTPSSEEIDAFDSFISAMTNSGGLERCWMRLDGGWSDGGLDADRQSGLGPFLLPDADSLGRWGQPDWRMLRDIHLSDFALHLSDLERLAAQLKESGTRLDFLTLQRTRLLSGTWAQALEVLRNVEVEYEKQLVEPNGAECEDVTMMRGGRYDVVFGRSWDETRSLADDFINGDMKHNPLHESYTVEFLYSVDGEDVTVEVTVGDESEGLPEAGEAEDEVATQVISQIAF
ncbi:hypothetical protein INS49_003746 [Diaporthe citri]|uniref:uncharacterized protein n=1 Tax=Diaporthe citri TaxID=83186 RepID=UPI001C7E4FCE|nr:uncharacterized protein INS49_003746 [Diaporthe citri]KAG6355780.1 hypothetical protein INS49_003746 [Diaporthe citri]